MAQQAAVRIHWQQMSTCGSKWVTSMHVCQYMGIKLVIVVIIVTIHEQQTDIYDNIRTNK